MEDRQPSAGYKYFPGSEDSARVVQIVEHDEWVPATLGREELIIKTRWQSVLRQD